MNLLRLILKELWHHRGNTVWTAAALVAAVALLVAVRLTTEAAQRETTRVMRDLGFNLRILPAATDMAFFWAKGHSDLTMPEENVQTLSRQKDVFMSFNHLTATLRQRYRLGKGEVILEGVAPSVTDPGKKPMGFTIPQGTLYLGHAAADMLGARRGEPVALAGHSFKVERVLAENGTDDDIRVYGRLSDIQAVLDMVGRINEIQAIDCLCLTADDDPLSRLRSSLETLLPGTKVLQMRVMADARARQRHLAERFAAYAVPFVLIIAALWVGALAILNVRERRPEIGLWRALGCGSGRLALLFLGKAVLVGALAGAVGAALGGGLALSVGPRLVPVTAASLHWQPELLLWALILTPAFAAFASFVPAMLALNQDPVETLRAD